jgi:hypothetical protein
MLKLTVKREERWDDEKEMFVPAIKEHVLSLEHSLLSISKWEAIYHKPFLSTDLTKEMIITYAKCMSINPNVPDEVFECITAEDINKITDYIKDPMTATWFTDQKPAHSHGRMNGEVITAEIVYYWMIQAQIPVEFQKWHLNRLLTLIRVISIKNDPKGNSKKMTAAERRALNQSRKAKYGIRG